VVGVALGGSLGTMARYWMSHAVARLVGETFPWGTLLINVLGSFVIGWFGTFTLPNGPRPASEEMRLFVMVGICGGFTTFSAFSLHSIYCAMARTCARGRVYIVASVLLCVTATVFGHYLAAGMTVRT
jgi:fluoride exporter